MLVPRATQEVFVQAPPSSGIAITAPVDLSMEQLPSDAEIVPLGLPQPAELPERSAWRGLDPPGCILSPDTCQHLFTHANFGTHVQRCLRGR